MEQSLYRKYRPKNLNEIYGQPVVVNILKNALKNNKISHAYLFAGSRGCGKTSVAKILARMVNCESSISGVLCNKCESCIESSLNSCVDIIEMDAASNNGVDEIRELKQNIYISPTKLKYKVYIIDEVHMLSTGAFNALLKTLEEPPEHAIFILATTDPEKIPSTILSRCQTLEFKKINKGDMKKRLKEISNAENIKIDDNALEEIVESSDGGMRDAIGLLELAATYSNCDINENTIFEINGNINSEQIEELCNFIINFEIDSAVEKIKKYDETGKNLIKILENIIKRLCSKMINGNTNICTIEEILVDYLDKMKKSDLCYTLFEIALYKISFLNKKENNTFDIKFVELNDKKNDISNSTSPTTLSNVKKVDNDDLSISDEVKKIRINNTFVNADKKYKKFFVDNWKKLDDYTLDNEIGAMVCNLLDAKPVVASDKYLILSYDYESFVEKGNSNLKKYESIIKKIYDLQYKLVFITVNEWKDIVKNFDKNKKYEYIDETNAEMSTEAQVNLPEKKQENNDILNKASELFGNIKIEVEE